jgi:hypothetical protein
MTTALVGPEAWLGADMARSTEWVGPLSARAIDELDAALRGLRGRGLGWPRFGRDDFPLPTLAPELAAVLDELEYGRGFVVLRGLPVARYADEELKEPRLGPGHPPGPHPLSERVRRADR